MFGFLEVPKTRKFLADKYEAVALPRPEEAPVIKITLVMKNKNGQAIYITPLRPPTLAAFPPWGDSAGAGCAELAHHKYRISSPHQCIVKLNFIKYLGSKIDHV